MRRSGATLIDDNDANEQLDKSYGSYLVFVVLVFIFSKISLSFWNFSFQKQPPPHALTADNCEFFHPASYIGLLLFFSPLIAPVQAC